MVVLGLSDFTALQCGSIFPKLRLIGRFKFTQFLVGGAASEKQSRKNESREVENLFHDARRVRLGRRVVKRSRRNPP